MRIGIVGAGSIGGTLATLFTRAGHEVTLANSRDPGTLADQVAALGPNGHAGTAAEAAAFGDVVVLAIPYGRGAELDPAPFAGKVVVQADNYYPARDGQIAELDEKKATSSGLLARHLTGATVVKAFNTIYWEHLRDRGRTDLPPAERFAIPVAGDDDRAKALVSGLIEEIGFGPVDAGPLDGSWRQEPGTPVYGAQVTAAEAAPLLAAAER